MKRWTTEHKRKNGKEKKQRINRDKQRRETVEIK